MPRRATDPIEVPDSLWQRPQMIDALRDRMIGHVFSLISQYTGASQTQIGIACGMTQGQVSITMKEGGRQVLTMEVFERVADGLRMPDPARMTLGLAPKTHAGALDQAKDAARINIPPRDEPADLAHASIFDSLEVDLHPGEEDEDPLRRRTFNRLTTESMLGAILADVPPGGSALEGVEAFAAALAGYPDVGSSDHQIGVYDLGNLGSRVAAAKRSYQACHYSKVISNLPKLLADLRTACQAIEGDDLLQAHVLSAEAHHVAASILLKLDDEGLAWVAADRSMQAARNSEDPTIIGSSARIVTHALVNDGHYGAATMLASRFAERFDANAGRHTPDSLSVYGSLLLRGAVAAGQSNNRGTAHTLLNEAEEAGRRLGGDFNHRWTAFGPTNVQLHRVNIAMLLGDAGAAVNEARSIDLDRVPITERKASLLIDTSRALTQWGRHEKAYNVLRAAHQLAPEEVAARPAAHRMLRDLLATSPPSIGRQIREFAAQIGVRV